MNEETKIRDDSNKKWIKEIRQKHLTLNNSNSNRSPKEIKEYLFESLKKYLQCVNCGERHIAVLDFHHSNPLEKDFQLSQAKDREFKKMINEAEKCQILCSNCHRIHHYEERNKKSVS